MGLTGEEIRMLVELVREKYGKDWGKEPCVAGLQAKLTMMAREAEDRERSTT